MKKVFVVMMVMFFAMFGGMATAGDFGGAYLGISPGVSYNGIAFGVGGEVFGGYNLSFGKVIVGGELSYGNVTGAYETGVAVRGGYEVGNFLPYAEYQWNFIGVTPITQNVGVGLDYMFDNGVFIGTQWSTEISAPDQYLNLRIGINF